MIPTLFIGIPGGPELLIVLFLAVLLFGANKLPSLARSMGQAQGEFKKGRDSIEDEIREAAREPGRSVASETVPESEPAESS